MSRSHSSSSCVGRIGLEMTLRNMLCGDVRCGECASDGGTGMGASGFWRIVWRRERVRLTPELLLIDATEETGRERGRSDVGEDVCDMVNKTRGHEGEEDCGGMSTAK